LIVGDNASIVVGDNTNNGGVIKFRLIIGDNPSIVVGDNTNNGELPNPKRFLMVYIPDTIPHFLPDWH
jgi:hypothetical protein